MSQYKRYGKYGLLIVLGLSIGVNAFYYIQFTNMKGKIVTTNSVLSMQVESTLRETMHSIKQLKEIPSPETMGELQRAVQDLALVVGQWTDLNGSEKLKSSKMGRSVSAAESLKNTVAHHLSNQYSIHNQELSKYDLELLDKIYEQLDRLLLGYHNVEEHIKGRKGEDKSDGGLGQLASNLEEIARLYRHSRVPNHHPQYITVEQALNSIDKNFPQFIHFPGDKEIEKEVIIKDGVHYYAVNYYDGRQLDYTFWIDAINGEIRNYEKHRKDKKEKKEYILSSKEALEEAQKFLQNFQQRQFIEEAAVIKKEKNDPLIYTFQFTPLEENVAIVCDRIRIDVDSASGDIVKYYNDFSGTIQPTYIINITREELEEKNKELIDGMEYGGLAVVRSFYTYYQPSVAYSYTIKEKDQERKVYFDVSKGNQIFESYSVYQPVNYTALKERFQ